MSIRNKRSHSSSSIRSLNESVYDLLESGRCDLSDIDRRLTELSSLLRSCLNGKQNDPHQKQIKHVLLPHQDYDNCLNIVKSTAKKAKKVSQTYERLFEMQQEDANRLRQAKEVEIRRRIQQFQDELKQYQSQYNRNIMALNAQFTRKQQDYQQLFGQFVKSLNNAQRLWSKLINDLDTRLKGIALAHINGMQNQNRYREFYEEIIEMVGQLNLRNNDSISQDMSYPDVMDNRFQKNTIDMSSIHQIDEEQPPFASSREHSPSRHSNIMHEQNIEQSLILLTKAGFFHPDNQPNITKIFNLARQSTDDLTRSPFFPIIIEFMKNNLNKNEQSCTLQDDIIQEQSVSLHSPLSNRVGQMESIMSRHLDIDQMIIPEEEILEKAR